MMDTLLNLATKRQSFCNFRFPGLSLLAPPVPNQQLWEPVASHWIRFDLARNGAGLQNGGQEKGQEQRG